MLTTSDVAAAGGLALAPAPVRIRRLLCATDFSEPSAAALDTAVELAHACGADLTTVFVLPLLSASPWEGQALPAAPEPAVRSVVARDLHEFVEPARRAGVPVQQALKVGDPTAEILGTAAATQADIVVVATHGRSGFDRWMLGSVAERVLWKAPCPVLTVPRHDEAATAAGPILCALDLSETSPTTLRYALALGRAMRRPVTVLHVVEDLAQYQAAALGAHLDWPGFRNGLEADARARLRRLVDGEGYEGPLETVVVTGRPHREVLEMARGRHAAMIVVGLHGKGGAAASLFGSTTTRVVRGASCPVLTVRPAKGCACAE